MTADNVYVYLHDIEENPIEYMFIYSEEREKIDPAWKDSDKDLYCEIQSHLWKAIYELEEKDFKALVDSCYKIADI
jgi:hypothetical protein